MKLQTQVTVRETQRRALARLRENIADIEGRNVRFDTASFSQKEKPKIILPTGEADFDARLGGGLILPALTEIYTEAARDAGALTGLMISLLSLSTASDGWAQKPVLWISAAGVFSETGTLYGLGLKALGFDPSRLFLTTPKRLEDALWICEEAARTNGLGATVLDMRGHSSKLNLRETQRLHVRAQSAGQPVFLLRQSTLPQTSAAPQRLVVKATASQCAQILSGTCLAREQFGSIGPPGFEITLEKNKNGPAGSRHILHWNSHERTFYTATRSRAHFASSDRRANDDVRHSPQNENRETTANAHLIA